MSNHPGPTPNPALARRLRPLASRLARLVAFTLDGITAAACIAVCGWLGSETLGAALWCLAYAYLMTEHGQTPGKALVGLQIVGRDGRPVGFLRGAVARNLAVPALFAAGLAVAGQSPVVRASLDEPTVERLAAAFVVLTFLPILGRRRRCLHDHLTGTDVVRAR